MRLKANNFKTFCGGSLKPFFNFNVGGSGDKLRNAPPYFLKNNVNTTATSATINCADADNFNAQYSIALKVRGMVTKGASDPHLFNIPYADGTSLLKRASTLC